jgi:hypothetical protein
MTISTLFQAIIASGSFFNYFLPYFNLVLIEVNLFIFRLFIDYSKEFLFKILIYLYFILKQLKHY